jgi:predicted Rdx family selenoprotein
MAKETRADKEQREKEEYNARVAEHYNTRHQKFLEGVLLVQELASLVTEYRGGIREAIIQKDCFGSYNITYDFGQILYRDIEGFFDTGISVDQFESAIEDVKYHISYVDELIKERDGRIHAKKTALAKLTDEEKELLGL